MNISTTYAELGAILGGLSCSLLRLTELEKATWLNYLKKAKKQTHMPSYKAIITRIIKNLEGK